MTTLRSPVLIVWLTIAACCLTVPLAAAAPAPAPAPDDACAAASPNPPKPAAPDPAAPRISDLKFLQVTRLGNRARFRLAISGSNLGSGLGSAKVYFTTKDAAHPVEDVNYLTVNPRELVVEATVPIGAEISRVDVEVGGKSGSSDGLVVSFMPAPPIPALKSFGVVFEHQKNKQFPNLHSVLVTKKTGGDGVGFAGDPNLMQIELIPTGATDLRVALSNEHQMDLHFVAAADYEPQEVAVTVFDSTDLAKRRAVAAAVKAPPPSPPEDPDQPKVTGVDILFLDRSQGWGRLRIHGQGFGEPPCRPAFAVDEYVTKCLMGDRISQPACGETEEDKKRREEKERKRKGFCDAHGSQWDSWQAALRSALSTGVSPRNEVIGMEESEIVDYNDKMVDVFFKFKRASHYSWPFRPANVHLTVRKAVHKAQQTVDADGVTGTVTATMAKAFTVSQDLGPKRDPALSYRYTVLDKPSAKILLGDGVGENFYVLQLSVVNQGSKKVAIPLAAIQAEVEWAVGHKECIEGQTQPDHDYVEGSPTLSPIPLAAVSAYFDAYQKSQGWRARFFNILDGITTLAATLNPFVGPSFKDAQSVFTGGFIPGAHKVLGDLSGQQLQNLTGLSWETIETLSANGGSKEKLIYIQRNEQFADKAVDLPTISKQTRKQITSILDLDITSFQVEEGEAQQATPAAASGAPKATSPAPTGGASAAAKP
jgi:hypothetical protein